jgi:CheY-like chemotaxis protein
MAGFRLLLADDDEDDFFIISQALEELERSYSLEYVRNGKELLDRLHLQEKSGQPAPDLILLDINMPLVNGFEALEQIRNTGAYAQMPIVMYSTSSSGEERDRCMMLGANAFFTKAYSFKKVQSFVTDIDQYLTYPHRMPQPRTLITKTIKQ